MKFISEKLSKIFGKNKAAKIDKNGLGRGPLLILAGVLVVSTVTGCSQETQDVPVTPATSVHGTANTAMQDQYDRLAELVEGLQSEVDSLRGKKIGVDDGFLQADWEAFVTICKQSVAGKINNLADNDFVTALTILNLDYLDENGKQILLAQYADGQDIERILNNAYSLLSQIREHNLELTSVDDYFSYNNLIVDERDQAILAVLDGYAKEIYTLSQDLTAANKTRIQEIFNIILAFANGTGTINVTIDGTVEQIAKIDLSKGGILAGENVAQTISVMSRGVVSQLDRERLDNSLRAKDTLAKIQETITRYLTLGTFLSDGVSIEEQERVVEAYNRGLAIISAELQVMGVTEAEAQSLYIIANIDYFMNGQNSKNAFNAIYADGFDINATFTQAESAVQKIQAYNEQQSSIDNIYDLARIFMVNEKDAISVRALSQTAYNVTSGNEDIATNAVAIMKGYSQYSADVTVDYTTLAADGSVIHHSLDKNALSKGATQVVNWLTFYSIEANTDRYGSYADSIRQLVDGTQLGLSPYQQIVLMVTDYCAENNIVVFDYEMGATR